MSDNNDGILTQDQWAILKALMTAASLEMDGSITTVWSTHYRELYKAAHEALKDNPKANHEELIGVIKKHAGI